ncbi:putative disease resistance protein RGA4 [Bienertia sinuspersici]
MVLVTTRDDVVAEIMHASSVHHLSGLSDHDSWALFNQIAFANRPVGDVFALEASGRKILQKCKGVPLAIKSIAGLLHGKTNPYEWTIIETSELWNIFSHHETGILPSLKLSYNHLSSPLLKKCFSLCAYCSKGFHFARSVAMHERLYFEDGKKQNDVLCIQHLSIYKHGETTLDFPRRLVLEKIRSLEVWGGLPSGLLMHVKYLRVLSLERSKIEELPEMIGRFKCLKYLDLANNPIKKLPESVMELYNLQSLTLYDCQELSEFPTSQLGNLVNLRHLGLELTICPPKGILLQLNQLHTLPTLQLSEGGFEISELGCLHHIRGKLKIKGIEVIRSKLDAEKANLSKKTKVEQLRISWDNEDNYTKCEEVLDGLYPHTNLKLLSIKGYQGDKFPSWLRRMNVSKEIELIDCGRCQELPTLGHLCSLKMIVLRNIEKLRQIGPDFYYHEDAMTSSNGSSSMMKLGPGVFFASLKELGLHHLGNLEEWWEPSGGGFPLLEELVIEECWELKRMPNNFPSLRELTIRKITNSHPLQGILTSKTSLSCLKKLHIEEVVELIHIPEDLGECTSLRILFIRGCKKLSSLQENLSKLVSLEELTIQKCPNLVAVPSISGLRSLREFIMHRNNGLRGVPQGLKTCKFLEKLRIDCCENVETLPDLGGLNRLFSLNIRSMTKMIRQPPDWLYNLSCLRHLHIGTYEELNEFPDLSPLLRLTSLQYLYVYGWEQLQSPPEQLQHFTKLRGLVIADFDNMEHLPDWIGHLSSLEDFGLARCKKLKKLPSEEAMNRLTNFCWLRIEDCPLLEEAIHKNGPEHHKIAVDRIHVEIINSTH